MSITGRQLQLLLIVGFAFTWQTTMSLRRALGSSVGCERATHGHRESPR